MNKKSILYIFVVLLALSLSLGAVSAADDNATVTAGDTVSAVPEADVAVEVGVIPEEDLGIELAPEEIVWYVEAKNYGPDTAVDTAVLIDGSNNLLLFDAIPTVGYYDSGIWYVGDLAAGTAEYLILDTFAVDEGPYYVEALIISGTHDPNLSNNYDIFVIGEDAAAAQETLPAAGNPIAVALLALLAIGVGGLKRRL